MASFFQTFAFYLQELWLPLLIGFLLSGILNEFIPQSYVEKFLGEEGPRPIFIASFFGMLLPVCCFGSLPIAVTLRRKGARMGPVLAFLVATPATSVSALIVCWKLLGGVFTAYIFAAVILMGLVIGLIGNQIKIPPKTAPSHEPEEDCCEHPASGGGHRPPLSVRASGILKYAFITMPKEIGLELLLGVAIASFITVSDPVQHAIENYLNGIWAYVAVLVAGLMTYVCSTASVPMANALIESGMGSGPAMTYLLVGPITSYGVLLVLNKEFGTKTLILYLITISVLSLVFGFGFEMFSLG